MYVCISFLIWGCFKVWLWLWWRSDELDVCVSFSRIGLEQSVLLSFWIWRSRRSRLESVWWKRRWNVAPWFYLFTFFAVFMVFGGTVYCCVPSWSSFMDLLLFFSQVFSAPMGQILDRLQAFGGFEVNSCCDRCWYTWSCWKLWSIKIYLYLYIIYIQIL